MTRVITVKLPDPEELDECMLCTRPALPGTKWARYCRYHKDQADPIESVEDMSYAVYRSRVRDELDGNG